MAKLKPNCPLRTGLIPCECDLPRCPECNYTKHDAAFEFAGHRPCRGFIPPRKNVVRCAIGEGCDCDGWHNTKPVRKARGRK
jgi:hypothetical protein